VAKKPRKGDSESSHVQQEAPNTANDDEMPFSKGETSRMLKITLPSGVVLTESMFTVPGDWRNNLFSKGANVFVKTYPRDQSTRGKFILDDKGKLDGAAAMLYENGELQTLAVYSNNTRNGCLRQWDEAGKCILYAEYQRGRKNGVLCFLQKGRPWLVQEYDKGRPQSEYLVKWTQESPHILSTVQLTGGDITDMFNARQQLVTLEKTWLRNEMDLKKELTDLRLEKNRQTKQQEFVNGAADRRARERDRIQAHNAENAARNAAAADALRRSALQH